MDAQNETNYARPDFVRSPLHWESLNGPWDFLFDDEDVGLTEFWHRKGLAHAASSGEDHVSSGLRTIQVPSVFQSAASGINERKAHEVLWHERMIEDVRTDEEKEDMHRLLLRFGAVDYHATVWIGGYYV